MVWCFTDYETWHNEIDFPLAALYEWRVYHLILNQHSWMASFENWFLLINLMDFFLLQEKKIKCTRLIKLCVDWSRPLKLGMAEFTSTSLKMDSGGALVNLLYVKQGTDLRRLIISFYVADLLVILKVLWSSNRLCLMHLRWMILG